VTKHAGLSTRLRVPRSTDQHCQRSVWLSEFRCECTCCRRVDIAVTLYTCIRKVRGSKLDWVQSIPDTCISVILHSPRRMSGRNIEISVFIYDHFTLSLPAMKSQKLEFWSSQACSFYKFIHQWLYSPLLGPGLFFSFVIFFTQTVGLLGRGISPSQDRCLYTGQHTDTHALSGIRTHDPSVRASEDSSCLRPHRYCGRQFL
jgi:hypothetical protein